MRAIRLSACVLVGFCAGFPALSAEPLQYKGVPLGASEKTLRAAHPQFTCGASNSGGERSCVIRGGTYPKPVRSGSARQRL